MDIMIPYLSKITRLAPESKGAFHIAGVLQSPAMQKIGLENKKKRELEKKQKISTVDQESNQAKQSKNILDDENHLDTWA